MTERIISKGQARAIELRRRIRMALAALKAVEQCLELEREDATVSPDGLAERIRDATKAGVSRG
jgi:hypothetical protein